MNYENVVSSKSVLICRWHAAAFELLLRDDAFHHRTSSGAAGESIGTAETETMVLWHKVPASKLLACLRAAASELLRRAGTALVSLKQLFDSVAKVLTLWSDHWIPSEPHEELIPWVAWFRPISARNYVWEYTWPEEEYLHP